MGWFNKKEKEDDLEMPRLPELPQVSEFDLPSPLAELSPEPLNEALPSLPAMPPIKPLPKQLTSANFVPTNYPARAESIEGLGIKEIGGINPKAREIGMQFEQNIPKSIEPLYIRLDKFEITLSSFKEIKRKIIEIEELLFKIKETKMKEEKELEEWEKEIQGIKSRIDFIDKSIFNKLG